MRLILEIENVSCNELVAGALSDGNFPTRVFLRSTYLDTPI